jgi:hypothetical protein
VLHALFALVVALVLRASLELPLLLLIAHALSTLLPLMEPIQMVDALLALMVLPRMLDLLPLLLACALPTFTDQMLVLYALLALTVVFVLRESLELPLWLLPAIALPTPMPPTGQVPMVLADALLA